jgi:hypothetical protein
VPLLYYGSGDVSCRGFFRRRHDSRRGEPIADFDEALVPSRTPRVGGSKTMSINLGRLSVPRGMEILSAA